ncbi:MAG: hypothetical protein H7249_03385 [Chitinophagaceae bacterium]|nr:hypothetical protein [Oligoflexus sp.]
MKTKMMVPMILGFLFAVFILPRFANMSLAAKYRKTGIAFADEKEVNHTSCTSNESSSASITEVISKMKCRKQAASDSTR